MKTARKQPYFASLQVFISESFLAFHWLQTTEITATCTDDLVVLESDFR